MPSHSDQHDHARMDDDGFLHHDKLVKQAKRRFVRAAMAYFEAIEANGVANAAMDFSPRGAAVAAYRAWRALH